MRTTWAEGAALSRHRSAMLGVERPAPERERDSPAVRSGARSAGASAAGARSARKKRGLLRRTGIIPPAIGIAVLLVAIVYLASYLTTSNGSGAASMFGTIDGLGHSGSVAALEQERTTIIEMNAAAKTLTLDSKPVTADPTTLLSQTTQSEETGGTGLTAAPPPADPTVAQADAKSLLGTYGWDNNTQWTCLYNLWERESTWNVYADNTSSGAYGIPQADPGSKMATFGSDYLTDPVTQIKWGLYYINSTYGSPCAAWQNEVDYGSY
jgi:hypothetical protein